MASEKRGCLGFILGLGNSIAKPPKLKGPSAGKVGQVLQFECDPWSPLSDQMEIDFDWGDGTFRGLKTGKEKAGHSWSKPGVYQVRTRERCPLDAHDLWSNPMMVTISE